MSVYSGWWFGMMIQPDELIFFRGVETTNQPIINGMKIWDFITISHDGHGLISLKHGPT